MKFILGLILVFGFTQVPAQLKITNIKTGEVKSLKANTRFKFLAKTNFTNCSCASNELITCKLLKVSDDSIFLLASRREAKSSMQKKLTSKTTIRYKAGHEDMIVLAKNQVQAIRKHNKVKRLLNRDIGIPLIMAGVISGLVVSPLTSNELRPKINIATYSLLGVGLFCNTLKLSTKYFFQKNDSNKPIEWKF